MSQMPPMSGMPQQGLPPELMALLQGGGGAMAPAPPGAGPQMGGMGEESGEGGMCPCCGQPMPQPFNTAGGPNIPMPAGASGKPMPRGGGGQDSLMMALGVGGQPPMY